jgi:hypothetical protein
VTAERRETAGVLIIVTGMALFAMVYGFAPAGYHGSNEEQFDTCVESIDHQYPVRPDRRVAGSERPFPTRGETKSDGVANTDIASFASRAGR